MNFDYKKYDIIDIFEENANQLILMAIENTSYEDVVIINKITKSDFINSDFVHNYRSISSNVVSISETDEQVIIVNNYKDTQILTDYLKENTFDFTERTRIAKSFLTQVCNYAPLSYPLQKLLIKTDQLTIKNNLLIFSDYLFLDKYYVDVDFFDIMPSIGQTLKIILQLHKEAITTKMSLLISFIETLINGEAEFFDYNGIYDEFKILLSNMSNHNEIIQHTNFSKLDAMTSERPKVNLEFIKNKQRIKLAEASHELFKNSKLKSIDNSIKTPKSNDTELNLDSNPQVVFETDEIPDILYIEEEYDESNLEINSNFEGSFLYQDEELSEIKAENFNEDFSAEFNGDDLIEQDLIVYGENNFSSKIIPILNDLNLKETPKNQFIDEELNAIEDFETNDVVDIGDDYDDVLPGSIFENWSDNECGSTSVGATESTNETILDGTAENITRHTAEAVLDDLTEYTDQVATEALIDDVVKYTDSLNGRKINIAEEDVIQDESLDHIDDILDRNKNENKDLYIDGNKSTIKSNYHVPSFLLFFIFLLIITTLLLYYTFTYI